jgi:hypothetical protein
MAGPSEFDRRRQAAGLAIQHIIQGSPDVTGDTTWMLVERAKGLWGLAGRLADELGLPARDLIHILRAVDEAHRDGHGAEWVVRWVDARRLNSGATTTVAVVAACAGALEVDLAPRRELDP